MGLVMRGEANRECGVKVDLAAPQRVPTPERTDLARAHGGAELRPRAHRDYV